MMELHAIGMAVPAGANVSMATTMEKAIIVDKVGGPILLFVSHGERGNQMTPTEVQTAYAFKGFLKSHNFFGFVNLIIHL